MSTEKQTLSINELIEQKLTTHQNTKAALDDKNERAAKAEAERRINQPELAAIVRLDALNTARYLVNKGIEPTLLVAHNHRASSQQPRPDFWAKLFKLYNVHYTCDWTSLWPVHYLETGETTVSFEYNRGESYNNIEYHQIGIGLSSGGDLVKLFGKGSLAGNSSSSGEPAYKAVSIASDEDIVPLFRINATEKFNENQKIILDWREQLSSLASSLTAGERYEPPLIYLPSRS